MRKAVLLLVAILMFLVTISGAMATGDYISQNFEIFNANNFSCKGYPALCDEFVLTQDTTHYTGTYGAKEIASNSTTYKTHDSYWAQNTTQGTTTVGEALRLSAMIKYNTNYPVIGLDTVDGNEGLISLYYTGDNGCGQNHGGCVRLWNITGHSSYGSPYSDWLYNASCGALALNWYNVTMTLNQSASGVYDLDVKIYNSTQSLFCQFNTTYTGLDYIFNQSKWTFGLTTAGGSPQTMYYDDILLKTLSPAPAGSVENGSWVNPTPANNSHNLTQVTLNASCYAGNTSIIWFNASSNPTSQVVNGTPYAEYTTAVSSDGTYYYKMGCFDSALNNYSSNTTTRTWVYDTTQPSILLNPTNEFNINNYSMRNQYDDLLYLNITFVDNIALYGYFINITDSSNTLMFNTTNLSLSGTSYTYNNTINVSSWGADTYKIEIQAADSHTSNVIPDYHVTKKKSSIQFKTPNDNNIKIETQDTSTINAEKLVDRYNFDILFDDGLTATRSFRVKTDKCKLDYIEDSPYTAHFVSYCEGTGNWIDFEGVGTLSNVEKLDDYDYRVTLNNVPSHAIFNSIGGLNINDVNYTWYKGIITELTQSALAYENTSILFNITNDTSIKNISAWLSYNNTNYLTPSTINYTNSIIFNQTLQAPNASVFINHVWNITVYQGDNNKTNFLKTYNQSVSFFGLDSCITSNVTVFTFYIYNENNPTQQLTADFEWITESTYGDPNNVQTNYDNLTGRNNYSLCIFPQYANFTLDGYFRYTTDGGYTHRYYLVNHSTTNRSINISIYNWNNTGASDLRLTTRYNDNYAYFPNVVAKLQRRYIADNAWRTVQMDKSSEYGLLFFNIIEESQDYRLIYQDDDGNILKTTTSNKFVCDSGICTITQLLDAWSSGTTTTTYPVVNSSYNNATHIITTTWTMPTGDNIDVTYNVYKITGTNNTLICNTTTSGASSGVFTCDTTGYEGEAIIIVDVSGYSPTWIEFITMARSSIKDFITSGDANVIIFILVMVIGLSAIFKPAGVIIATAFSVVVVSVLGIASFITVGILAAFFGVSIMIAMILRD